MDIDSKEWKRALVISRAGKASGKNKYWFDIEDLYDNTMKSLNFENTSSWKNFREEILLCEKESFEVTEAKLYELENWKQKKVFTEVDNEGKEIISVRWVLSEMIQESISKVKGRLVARSFEDMDKNFVRKDSSTCGRENLRLVLPLITLQHGKSTLWILNQPFFSGKTIEREVFLKSPKEANTNKVWNWNTTVHGLCDAPSTWYLSVKEELINTGGVKSGYDDVIFFWHNNQLLQGILLSHVDDFF